MSIPRPGQRRAAPALLPCRLTGAVQYENWDLDTMRTRYAATAYAEYGFGP